MKPWNTYQARLLGLFWRSATLSRAAEETRKYQYRPRFHTWHPHRRGRTVMTGRSNKLNWTIFGWVDASRDDASLTEVLHFPPRPFFEVSDCPPATLILIAAFTSLSWKVPQKRHSHSRTFNAFLPPIFPQQEHRWDVGSHREIIRKLRPYLSDFADSISRK